MTMRPKLRKVALTTHVAASVGWLGAVGAFLAVAGTALAGDAAAVRDMYPAMQVIADAVIVPLALASLLTGLVSSLGTSWGLLRHYWVLAKLVLILVATVVLLLQLRPIAIAADAAGSGAGSDLGPETASLVVHSGGGIVILMLTTVLGIYKPRGMTRYGLRRGSPRLT